MVKYFYDAWGNFEISGNTSLGNRNPFRYRGYYYDTDTGFYYLKTRYYDPAVGRFLNMDDVTNADPTTVHGLNLYAYCGNNPVMNVDPTGTSWWSTALDWFSTITGLANSLSVVMMTGSLIVAACQGKGDLIAEDWNRGCFNPFNMDANVALNANVFSFYKGEFVIKLENSTEGLQIFGTIFLGDKISSADTLNHEFGHGIQERFLGPAYLTRVALPSVITYYVNPSDDIYYSMPWERTADWFGGVNRGNYKKGSLGWAFAENILGVGIIPWYFIFGF